MARIKRVKASGRSNPGEGVGGNEVTQGLVGVGAYAGSRVAGRILKAIFGDRVPALRKGSKVLIAAAALGGAYYLSKKPQFRKYRTAMIVGAAVAFVQAVLEEFVPALGNFLDVGPVAMTAIPQSRRLAPQQIVAQQYAQGARVAMRTPEDDYLDQMEANYYAKNGGGPQAPGPQQAYAPPPAQGPQAPPQADEGPGPEYDDEEFGGGIFDG